MLAKSLAAAERPPGSVRLLAVCKKKPVEAILEAVACGQREFGENFVQEGVEKIESVARDDLVWHLIGPLQSNKTRIAAEHFDWVHTIDRLKIAERLSRQRPDTAGDLNVCIQVNVDREPGKSGVLIEEVLPLATSIATLPNIRLRGLMCLPAIRDTFDEQRKPFAALREALARMQNEGFDVDTLSMGMTADFDAAIHEGATIVRIGTALFGARD